jgi:hypothetical protein
MKKTKKELMEEACKLADEYELKKQVIQKILEDLDNIKEFGDKHISGMATVEEIKIEMQEIEKKHEELLSEIKKG